MQLAAVINETSPLDRQALIQGHVDMARRLARKIARRVPRSVGRDELESAALLGLTEAACRFDPDRGEPFVAYAAKRVRGAVLDELRRNDVLTRRGRESARRLAEATRTVEANLGRAATAAEIAQEMGTSVEQVSRQQERLSQPAVLPLDEARDAQHVDSMRSPAEAVMLGQEKTRLRQALAAMPERDLQLLNMYYQDTLTLKEIGEVFGVSESRVCQLRTRALKRMRELMDA